MLFYAEFKERHDKPGCRIKRGLFKSNSGTRINADINAAYLRESIEACAGK